LGLPDIRRRFFVFFSLTQLGGIPSLPDLTGNRAFSYYFPD
jgi:hypothetical protein